MTEMITREEIKDTVFVPASVEAEIRTNIENQLKKCGIFYRVFSRRKSASSLEHKLATGKYGGVDEKKIQDLIGIRVNLYFQDDLDICKKLFEDMYQLVDGQWSENDMSHENFEASKINGVFRLPEYQVSKISPETWNLHIDQTFEIQLKTVFFEGWHEVEHDLRYKMKSNKDESESIWDQYAAYSRQFNSVVATLELCDRSMVTMFENFAHQLYKDHVWDMMIRMHFRVRISDQPLYEGIPEILENNHSELGKKLFKSDRRILIEKLKTMYREIPISVNMIIAILNKEILGDNEEINRIMKEHNVYRDGISEIERTYYKRDMNPLKPYNVFRNKVLVRAKGEDNVEAGFIYRKLANHLYGWMRIKFRPIFDDLPQWYCSYENMTPGYQVQFNVLPDELKLTMKISHIAQDVGCRMWNTEVEVYPNEDGTALWLEINNIMHDGRNISELERISRFSYPNFYRSIYSDEELTICDVNPYGDRVYSLRSDYSETNLVDLIKSSDRQSPVVILASKEREDGSGYLDESWIGDYWLTNIYKQVRYYAHVYRCDTERLKAVVHSLDISQEQGQGVYIFWPAEADMKLLYDFYDAEEIAGCVYNRYKGDGAGVREDMVQGGAVAFSFMLVDEIKRWNIKPR